MTKAQTLAAKPPLERAAHYEKWRDYFRAIAKELDGAEATRLHHLARNCAGMSALVRSREALAESCCWEARTLGSCECVAPV